MIWSNFTSLIPMEWNDQETLLWVFPNQEVPHQPPLFLPLVKPNLSHTLKLIRSQLCFLHYRQSHNSHYLIYVINERFEILINFRTLKHQRIHPSEVNYLGHHSLRQHLGSNSKFGMSHFLGQRIKNHWHRLNVCCNRIMETEKGV